jgi:hypothetical protein
MTFNKNCEIALMMEAARATEKLVNFYQTTWRYNPGDSHLRTHHRGHLKLHNVKITVVLLT